MKKSRKLATLGICSALFLGLAACQQQHATSEGTNQRQSSSAKVP
ncbi:lipoprotein%2C putative [Streptococcus pneumoniae]|nr:lipoprotein%2C putative [Streptococcus pneumoniae]